MAWRRPGDKPLSEPMMASLLTHICVTLPQWLNETGTSLDLYNVTNCTGNLLWCFTKITFSGNILHNSHYQQCTYAITKKKWCKIIPYRESDNIAAVFFSWLIENSWQWHWIQHCPNDQIVTVTIVTLRPYKTHSFTDFVILLHWTTLLSSTNHLMPLDNFETNLHNDKYATVLFHHDGLRCPGAK